LIPNNPKVSSQHLTPLNRRGAVRAYVYARASDPVFNVVLNNAAADHGVKAQGDGWIIIVSLIEGANIALRDSGTPRPYVVFSCNGKHRTSSVNLGTRHPTWRGELLAIKF
jgi:hypothetical protein